MEVPERLIQRYPSIESDLVAKVEGHQQISPDVHQIQLSFGGELAGSDLTRWLNLLLGNCSMMPGVRLIDLKLPDDVLAQFPGPNHGISGVRELTGVDDRPLVATALKPRGAPVSDLVEVCREFVTGGGDLLKDDHNLIDPLGDTIQTAFKIIDLILHDHAQAEMDPLFAQTTIAHLVRCFYRIDLLVEWSNLLVDF